MNEKVFVHIRVSYLESEVKWSIHLLGGHGREVFVVFYCLYGGGCYDRDALLSRSLVTLVDCHTRWLCTLLSRSLGCLVFSLTLYGEKIKSTAIYRAQKIR